MSKGRFEGHFGSESSDSWIQVLGGGALPVVVLPHLHISRSVDRFAIAVRGGTDSTTL